MILKSERHRDVAVQVMQGLIRVVAGKNVIPAFAPEGEIHLRPIIIE